MPNKIHFTFLRKIATVSTCVFFMVLGIEAQQSRPTVAGGTPAVRDELWLETKIAGQPAGFYHEKVERSGGNTLTTTENDLVINRLGTRVEIKSSSHYEENADGNLVGVNSDMSSSNQSTGMKVAVQDGSLLIHITSGDKSYDRNVSVKGAVLGPDGVRRLTISGLKTDGDAISYQMFLPELGGISTVTRKLIGREQLTVGEKNFSCLKLDEEISGFPAKSTIWVDGDGRMLREVQQTPFGEMAASRSEESKVAGSTSLGATLPEEAFTRTVVHSNIRLPEERLIEEVKLRITHHKPELGWPNLEADNQKILEKTANFVVLEVRRPMPSGAAQRPAKSSPELKPYLAPNALLQSDDANVMKIAKDVVGDERDLFRAARALQRWTADNMQFDPGIAIASGSEVARDRRGTCFGYSTLLASLLRAEGIPSRVRVGFAYAAGIWGGHAWVEILDGKSWIPLDGALYSPGPADAARFSIFSSAFEEGTIAQVGELGRLFGNVDIQILEYTVGGKRVVVPQDAKPFMVEGDTYQNPWFGLAVTKPASFHFTKLDSTWPEMTVVGMEGPDQEAVEIESHSASLPTNSSAEDYLEKAGIHGARSEKQILGHPAVFVSSADKAGLVIRDGGNIWVFKSSGPRSQDLLLQVASTLRFSAPVSHSQPGL